MDIKKATKQDIPGIVELHQRIFDGFFLTSMGGKFLGELYLGFISEESGILLVARDNSDVKGFVGGTTNPEKFYTNLLRKRWWSFAWKAIPMLLENPLPVGKKIFSAVWFQGDVPNNNVSGAVLSSIGVSKAYRGSTVATELLAHFEACVYKNGIKKIFLTTDNEGNERANAFYLKNGYKIESEIHKSDGRNMYRYIKYLSWKGRND